MRGTYTGHAYGRNMEVAVVHSVPEGEAMYAAELPRVHLVHTETQP